MCGVEARIVDDEGGAAQRRRGGRRTRGARAVDHRLATTAIRRVEVPVGWLRTGDVGRIDPQGYITLTDRAKDVIKSGGEWISSVELENHLIAHPAVREAAVVGVPDDRWQERPLAAVVAAGRRRVHAAGATRFPVRQGGSVVATGAVDVRRRDSAHQRGQVRQEDHPRHATPTTPTRSSPSSASRR